MRAKAQASAPATPVTLPPPGVGVRSATRSRKLSTLSLVRTSMGVAFQYSGPLPHGRGSDRRRTVHPSFTRRGWGRFCGTRRTPLNPPLRRGDGVGCISSVGRPARIDLLNAGAHKEAHHIVALLDQQAGRNAGIDTTAHGDNDFFTLSDHCRDCSYDLRTRQKHPSKTESRP